jgi:hypothetical protein
MEDFAVHFRLMISRGTPKNGSIEMAAAVESTANENSGCNYENSFIFFKC